MDGTLVNQLTSEAIRSAIEVHRALGPGLLESTYEACMVQELVGRNIQTQRQKPLPVMYKGVRIDCGYRIDLLLENQVIIELKAVARLESIHEAQLLSYLKLSGCQVGLLINFNVRQLKSGLRRLVNNLPKNVSAVSAISAVNKEPLNAR